MQGDKLSFNRTIALTAARLFGIVFSFAIPMYLGRTLEVEHYGTYKQIMIFYWFSQVALNLGLDDSAYYFLRWEPKKFSLFSFNALIFNLVVSTTIALLFVIFQHSIAHALNNPELAQYIPLLSLLMVLTISSMQLEGILIGLERVKERIILEVSVEILKALAILCGFIFYNSIQSVLILLNFIMFARLIMTIVIIDQNKKREGLSYSESLIYLRRQIKYGLPLGLSRIYQNILNLEKFLISSFHSMRDFTFYTVGCFENPFINATQASFYEMANIEMIDAMKNDRPDHALELWRNMIRKLMMVVIPFVVYMIFFAKEIMIFIFSERYVDSTPYFVVFNLGVLVAAFNPEPLFRASSKTHAILKIKTIGLIVGGLGLVFLAQSVTPIKVLWAKTFIIAALNTIGLIWGAALIKAKPKNLFRWRQLVGIFGLSLSCALILLKIFSYFTWNPFWVLSLSFSLYVLSIFLLSCQFGLIAQDERDHLLRLMKKAFHLKKM